MEYIDKIVTSLGWPHVTLIFTIFFVLLFRKPIIAFISRIKTVGKGGVTTDTSPEAQRDEKRKKAIDELMNIGDSLILNEVEQSITKDLSLRGLETTGDSTKVLIRHLAASQIALDYEQIHNLIFGSQISLLKQLNEVGGQGKPKEFMEEYFARIKEKYQELNTWTLNQYLEFLQRRILIFNVNSQYYITPKGVDYLFWIVRNGRTENRIY